MAGFDASGVLEPLSYTGLSAYGIPDGVVSEPSNAALAAFVGAISALQDAPDDASGEDILAKVHQATSDFCSGTPTVEQFAAMPPRLFREFAKWLASEFIDPKG